jgi:hypothetical protein
MKTSRLSLSITAVFLSIVMAQAALANSAIQLTSIVGGTLTIVDNGAGDINPLLGQISITPNTTLGNFTIFNLTGTTQPLLGSPVAPVLSLTGSVQKSSGDTLDIFFSSTDFAGPANGTATSTLHGTLPVPQTSPSPVIDQTFKSQTNQLFALTDPISTLVPPLVSGAFDATATTPASILPQTSLTEHLLFLTPFNVPTGFTADIAVTQPVSAPEIGTTVCLLALGLVAIEVFRQRWRAKG